MENTIIYNIYIYIKIVLYFLLNNLSNFIYFIYYVVLLLR